MCEAMIFWNNQKSHVTQWMPMAEAAQHWVAEIELENSDLNNGQCPIVSRS